MGAQKFADLVAEKTGGSVKIEVFPSSQLGNQRDLVEGVQFGTIDFTLTSTAVMGNFVPEVNVFDLPFIIRDIPHAYKALDTVGMEAVKSGEAKGIKTLAFMENGVRHVTNNRAPVKVPADMKGLKIRVQEQPVYIEMMKLLDASPVPMAFGELYTALEKGVIDAQENPLAHIYTARFFEVQKFVSLTGHVYAAEPILVSMAVWNKLSPEQQKAVEDAANEATTYQRDLCRQMEGEFIKKINESGKSKINDDVDTAAFAEATKATWKLWTDSFPAGQALIDKVLAVK
jgi:tripartite ATP-independent transporter DctP family solute receptor